MDRCYIKARVLLIVVLLQLSLPTCWSVSLAGEGLIQTFPNDATSETGTCTQSLDESVLHECTVASSSPPELSSTASADNHPSCTNVELVAHPQHSDPASLPAAVYLSTGYKLADISNTLNSSNQLTTTSTSTDSSETSTTTTNTNSSETPTTSPTPQPNPPASVITQPDNTGAELAPDTPSQPTLSPPLPVDPSPQPPASPPDTPSPQTSQPRTAVDASPATADDNPITELRHLLVTARQAVAALEAAVDRQEVRMKALPPSPGAADPNPSADAGDALVAALGLDPYGSAAAAAREALRQAVDQVLSEQQRRRPGAPGAGDGGAVSTRPGGGAAVWAPSQWGEGTATGASTPPGPGGQGVLMPDMGPGAGVGLEGGVTGQAADWFRRHFSLRAAVTARVAAAAVAAVPADGGGSAGDGEDTGGEGAVSAAAALVTAAITCAFPYELPHPNAAAIGGGKLQYIVVGDAAGNLYLLSAVNGRTLTALPTGSVSAITACTAYYVRSGESMVVTGHADGATRSFHVVLRRRQEADGANEGSVGMEEGHNSSRQQQTTTRLKKKKRKQTDEDGSSGYDVTDVAVQSIVLRHVVASMPQGALPWAAVEELIAPSSSTVAAAAARASEVAAPDPSVGEAAQAGGTAGLSGGDGTEVPYTGPPAPIMHIVPFRLGHKVGGRRLMLVLDRAGNMRLERDNGTIRHWARTNRTQLAVRFVSNYVVMLSAHHATIFNTMQMRPPRAFVCQHLNGSRLLAASFDGHRPFRGFGVNTRGELVTLVTPHEGGLAVCKATRAAPLPWLAPALAPGPDGSPPRSPPPLSLTPLRGYLLLTHGSSRVLFNVTGVTRMALPPLAAISDEQIARVAVPAASPLPPPSSCPASTPSCPHQATSPHQAGPPLPPAPVLAVGPGSQVLLIAIPAPPPPSGTYQRPTGQLGDPDAGAGVQDPTGPVVAGGGGDAAAITQSPPPLLLVVLDSRLPRLAALGAGSKMWSQPVFIAAMVLVGLYQFWRMSSGRAHKRAGGGRSGRFPRRGPHGGYGGYGSAYGDAAEYMYGENRVPTQPRSALRRTRSDRPTGRSVTYEDEEDY